jgi:hypothetical protein
MKITKGREKQHFYLGIRLVASNPSQPRNRARMESQPGGIDMKKVKGLYCTVLFACLTLLPELASAAGCGAAPISLVSDTRKLEGIMKWWGSIYNDSHLEFTILTCVMIPLVGCVLGFAADYVLHWIGLDLTKRELAEH